MKKIYNIEFLLMSDIYCFVRLRLEYQTNTLLAFIQRGDAVVLQPLHQTLADFRGSVPVDKPQDFNAIRQEVFNSQSYRTNNS